jgi:hypothetical protein
MESKAFKCTEDNVELVFKVINALNPHPSRDPAWFKRVVKTRKENRNTFVRYLYVNEHGQLMGFDSMDMGDYPCWPNIPLVDCTVIDTPKSIMINGKTIEISDESFDSLKKSLGA